MIKTSPVVLAVIPTGNLPILSCPITPVTVIALLGGIVSRRRWAVNHIGSVLPFNFPWCRVWVRDILWEGGWWDSTAREKVSALIYEGTGARRIAGNRWQG